MEWVQFRGRVVDRVGGDAVADAVADVGGDVGGDVLGLPRSPKIVVCTSWGRVIPMTWAFAARAAGPPGPWPTPVPSGHHPAQPSDHPRDRRSAYAVAPSAAAPARPAPV